MPDPADTSKTTDETTEISLTPTTPSQQTRSVPVNFGQSSVKIVPDSQSAPGSSSYLPSATGTVSSSAPGPGQGALQTEEHPSISATNEVERETTGGAVESPAQQDIEPQSESAPMEEEVRSHTETQDLLTGERIDDSVRTHESPVRGEEDERVLRELHESPPWRAQSKSPIESNLGGAGDLPSPNRRNSQREIQAQGVETADIERFEQPASSVNQYSSAPLEVRESRAQSTDVVEDRVEAPTDRPEIADGLEVGENQQSGSAHGPEHIDSSTQSASQQIEESQGGVDNNEPAEIEQSDEQGTEQRTPTVRRSLDQNNVSATAPIDLTATQDQPASISRFSPTPPERQPLRPFGFAGRRSSPQALASSAWQSTFPFQTQLSKPETAKTIHSNSASPRADVQSHAPLREVPRLSPRGQPSPFTSSSIPPIPSQSIKVHTFGESAPPAPITYSSSIRPSSVITTMDQSPPPGSLLEKLRAMRQASKSASASQQSQTPSSAPTNEAPESALPTSLAQPNPTQPSLAAKLASPFLMAHDRTARSPSVVPAMEPLPVITQDEMNTSPRCETLLPQSQEGVSDETQQNGSLTASGTPGRKGATESSPELASMHVVPIYFIGHQRDQYPQMVYFHKDLVQRVLASNSPDAELTSEAKQFVDRIRRVTMHPDLDNTETFFTQYDVEPSQQANWDVNCSAKFRFLKELLNHLRSSSLHVAILAQPGRAIDILETFLRGIRVSYHRPGATTSGHQSESQGNLKVSLLASGTAMATEPADLVIAMDNSVKYTSEQIRNLRQVGNKWAPVVTLIVPHSVEHIERCLSPTLSDRARTRALVAGIQQFRNEAGRAQDGQDVLKDTASLLAQYLTHAEMHLEWPLPALANLEDLDSQTESEVDITVSNADTSRFAIVGEKRLRDDDEGMDITDSSKRSRVESPIAEHAADVIVNPQELDVTHISDSIEKATQPNTADTEAEASSPVLNSTEKRLQDLLRETQDRLEEHVRVLSDLQYRHEEQRTKLIEVTTERDAAIATAQNAVTRLTEESNKMSNLRSENSTLKEQLREANAKLLDHSVPERAEFGALRLEAAQAKADKEKVERRLEQANKDVSYVRELYQNSSTSAQSLAAQVTELENQLAVAQNRVTGEQVKLRTMGYETFTKNLQDENKKLKAMLKEREAALKFRDEEIAKLKEASRGRMGTRGTSVPRSPRLDSPRIGSRQTSPAPGELRGRSGLLHPLRNA